MFLCDNQWKFWTFSILQLWNRFSGKRKNFSKSWSNVFLVESIKIENALFPYKLPYQKSMLRQIEWWAQNGAITKNEVLPVTTLFFWKFCFSLRTSYRSWFDVRKTQMPTLLLSVSTGVFIFRSFFPVSIINTDFWNGSFAWTGCIFNLRAFN